MKNLALVLARGGSKRIPNKNTRKLGEKPLIVWSIDVAKGIPEICDILVSTDDEEIAETARVAGALVPWLRPAELASDTASSVDAGLHALDWYERERGSVDGLLLLQPTSPFRGKETVRSGIEMFRANKMRPVIGVSLAESHPMWCYRVEGNSMKPFIAGGGLGLRSQDLPPAYVINGAFYLIAPKDLRKGSTFIGENAVALVMPNYYEGIDIDTEADWQLAEFLCERMKINFSGG
jgi:CMP-N,N'-diacetyllegionaminic acid synthase